MLDASWSGTRIRAMYWLDEVVSMRPRAELKTPWTAARSAASEDSSTRCAAMSARFEAPST
jgi:hypothetical protein